jgi:hypothetical protein
MSTYNPNIPQGTDNLSVSQGQMLNNFTQLNTQFGVDHIAFNTGSANGDGHHVKVFFDNAPSTPSVSGTQSVMFPALVSGQQQMMWKNASNSYQITGLPVTAGTNGSITLIGGIIFKWATVQILNGNQTATYTFSGLSIGNFPSNCYNVQATAAIAAAGLTAGNFPGITGISNTGFTINRNGTGGTQSYLVFAIGN